MAYLIDIGYLALAVWLHLDVAGLRKKIDDALKPKPEPVPTPDPGPPGGYVPEEHVADWLLAGRPPVQGGEN